MSLSRLLSSYIAKSVRDFWQIGLYKELVRDVVMLKLGVISVMGAVVL